MTHRTALLVAPVLIAAALAGCVRRTAVVPSEAHYVVGPGYRLNGTWYYPHEDFRYAATGLAVVQAANSHGVTVDGEAIDGSAMTASHQTLQLPAIVRVTNLSTGLQVLVRVNDRGPGTPKRLIGLSPRAGELLGISAGAVTPVRVEVDEAMSTALRDQLNGGPKLTLAAAPRGAVTMETLAPPPGIGQSSRARSVAAPVVATSAPSPAQRVPDRLPDTVTHVPAGYPSLAIEAGSFGQMAYARQVAARLSGIGARVDRLQEGRSERYTVRAGPFSDVAAADAALDQAMAAGVTDAKIVVQ